MDARVLQVLAMTLKRSAQKKGMTGGKKRKVAPTGQISALKHELDRLFSLYIRAKYPKRCFTCGKRGAKLQNGHFIARSYLATRFDEDNCRPQCWGCNGYGLGRPLDFEENLIKEIGQAKVDALKKKRHEITILTPQWYEEKILEYRALVE